MLRVQVYANIGSMADLLLCAVRDCGVLGAVLPPARRQHGWRRHKRVPTVQAMAYGSRAPRQVEQPLQRIYTLVQRGGL